MASTFKTSSGSIYTFDARNKIITGGVFGNNAVQYIPERTQIFQNAPAIIQLSNGQVVRTSKVRSIV